MADAAPTGEELRRALTETMEQMQEAIAVFEEARHAIGGGPAADDLGNMMAATNGLLAANTNVVTAVVELVLADGGDHLIAE